MDKPTGIPVMLEVANQRCVVVGGGPVGCRRARTLAESQARVVVVAPDMEPGLIKLAEERGNVELVRRGFEPEDLSGAFLVVIATNNERVNGEARRVAAMKNVLMDGAHASRGSDLTFMASERRGPLTISVHTGGASASAARQIRDALVGHLDPDWQTLLEQAAEARESLYQVADPKQRRAAMLALVDEHAMRLLKSKGVSALGEYHAQVVRNALNAG